MEGLCNTAVVIWNDCTQEKGRNIWKDYLEGCMEGFTWVSKDMEGCMGRICRGMEGSIGGHRGCVEAYGSMRDTR